MIKSALYPFRYVLVFGLDFLGNPVGLVKDLGGGVKDLFYEPYQGAIQGPEEFVEGKSRGPECQWILDRLWTTFDDYRPLRTAPRLLGGKVNLCPSFPFYQVWRWA